jgi:hypothetical protein
MGSGTVRRIRCQPVSDTSSDKSSMVEWDNGVSILMLADMQEVARSGLT